MRRRLQRFFPIFLIALALQVLAPISASRAVGIAAADPLQSAICHDGPTTGPGGQDGDRRAHDGACTVCAIHSGGSIDAPKAGHAVDLVRVVHRVFWPDTAASLLRSPEGSNTRARAPPQLT